MIFLVASFSVAGRVQAQITPPGLGNARTAAWTAIGAREHLDDVDRRVSLTYVGVGTTSGRDDANPFSRPDILVLNEEYFDQFDPHWMYSVGLSYRRQNAFESDGDDWRLKRFHELRLYGRFSSVLGSERVKVVNTLRPEIRGFVQPSFAASETPLQFRFRFKTQVAWAVEKTGRHKLIVAAEELASVGRDRALSSGWSDFGYRESRFSFFYSLDHEKLPCVVDVGLMNNLLGRATQLVDVQYVALDLVFRDPFAKLLRAHSPEIAKR